MNTPEILRENLISKVYSNNSTIKLHMVKDDKYIALKENYELHNWPNKTLVMYGGLEILSVNIEGAEVINKLNGEYTLNEILKDLFNEFNNNELRKYFSIKMFVFQLYKRNLIDFLEEKEYRMIKNTGTRKWYIPYSCSIEITKKCDLRCKHCYANCGNTSDIQLNRNKIISILDRLSDGCKSVSITGGDPMCHPNIKEIIEYSISHGIETTLITNGMRLDEEFAKWLSNVGIKRVKLSLDGYNEKMHDGLRGIKGAFNKVMKSMRNLKEVDVEFSIGTVITKDNVNCLEDIANIAYNNGAKSIGFGRIINQGRAITEMKDAKENNLSFIINKIDKIMRDYREKDLLVTYEEDGNWINTFQSNRPSLQEYYLYKDRNIKCSCNGCGAGSRVLFIEANGNIKPCMMSLYKMGEIESGDDLLKVVNEDIVERFRNLENPNISLCEKCKYYSNCLGCISQAMTNSSLVDCKWREEILKKDIKMKKLFRCEVCNV